MIEPADSAEVPRTYTPTLLVMAPVTVSEDVFWTLSSPVLPSSVREAMFFAVALLSSSLAWPSVVEALTVTEWPAPS